MLTLRQYIYTLSIITAVGFAGLSTPAFALPAERYPANSRMAQGRWVKIKVKEDGMQFVSDEQLKNMGFSSPEQVHVYGYGGRRLPQTLNSSMPEDVPLQLSVRNGSGIVFFGTGTVNWYLKGSTVTHEQNPYSAESYYFLSDAPLNDTDAVFSPLNIPYGTDDTRVSTFTEYLLHESELAAGGDTGSDLFGEDFRSTSTRTFTFDLPGAVNDVVGFYAGFAANAGSGYTVTYSSGEEQLATVSRKVTDSDTHVDVTARRMSSRQTEPGKGSITVNFAGSGVIYKAFLDFIECTYERALSMDSGAPLLFFYHVKSGQYPVFSISGISDNTLIWDVSDPSHPQEVKYDRTGNVATFAPSGNGLKRYVAFNPSQVVLTPVSAGAVANQDIHALETPNMVIITPKEFKTQAERVAQMHRDVDDMTVHVLTPDVIYNEFSSGAPDVTAYRRLLKMWYDRSASLPEDEKLGYCLLFGRPTYDQRQLTENLRTSSYPRILTWQSTLELTTGNETLNEKSSYVSDNYIGMLADCDFFSMGSAQMSVAVGRMPIKSVTEARTMVDKLVKYVETPDYGTWRSNVLMLADDGDNAIHAEQSMSVYKRMLKKGGEHNVYELMNIDAYEYGTGSYKKTYPQAKTRMLKLLDEGVSLWTYIGHANTTSLTGEDMWNYTDLTSMTNSRWPVFYTASCEFVRFDADAVSGCESMWLHPETGIIAAIAANRKVFIANNGNFSNAFGDNYFQRGADNKPRRLGQIYVSTVNSVGNNDTNKHRYAIVGDPAMRVPTPEYEVRVERLADTDIENVNDDSEYPVVPGLSKVKVSGSILTAEGDLATDFNGTVVPTLYDAEVVVTTKGHITNPSSPDGKEISYNDRKNRLFSGNFPVKNGKWEATLLVPEEIENNYTQARLALHAYTDQQDSALPEAGGSTDKFYIYGWDETVTEDTTDPEILYMYLNNSAFRNGATVGPNPVFKVKVRDDSGINISNSGVGRLMTVSVDVNKVFDNLADYYVTDPGDPTAGTVAYPLTGLSEGKHKLEFLVWDNAGNSTRSTLDFTIAPASEIPDLDIYTDASPAISSVTFYISSTDAVQGLVEVFDLSGRRVWYSEAPKGDGALSTKWNLTDRGGTRVPRGIYLYRATVRDAAGNETKATKKFAVGNP